MNPAEFSDEARKHLRKVGSYWTFIPPDLPPKVEWDAELISVLSAADRALGQLAGLGRTLPNPHLLIRPFTHREAVLSSQIEGTQASLSDLYLFEVSTKIELKAPDVREVSNYVEALEYGLQRVPTLPLSRRLICELHARLMDGVRGAQRSPGEFRRQQVWIGPEGSSVDQARFVPPPPGPELDRILNTFERYLQTPSDLPPIIRLAIVHYQFEAIHPFVDGNGRIGRLLITLMLCLDGILPQPLLYLSAYFERHRRMYYDLLLAVSQRNAWHDWLTFFCRGVASEAMDAVDRARRLMELQARYTRTIGTRRTSALSIKLVEMLFERPAITVATAAAALGVTPVAAQRHIDHLCAAGIIEEITGQRRNRVYLARSVIDAISNPTLDHDLPSGVQS